MWLGAEPGAGPDGRYVGSDVPLPGCRGYEGPALSYGRTRFLGVARYRRSSGRARRGPPRGDSVRGYTIRGRSGRVRYVGITNNPRRRAAQHRRSGKRGRLEVETSGMSRRRARRWEAAKLARFRKRNRGRNPTYNKTRSGGRRS